MEAVRKGLTREATKRIKTAMADFETYRRHALQLRSNSGALVEAARKHQAKPAVPAPDEANIEYDEDDDDENLAEEFG